MFISVSNCHSDTYNSMLLSDFMPKHKDIKSERKLMPKHKAQNLDAVGKKAFDDVSFYHYQI